jgi:hypothetical protein
MNCDIRARLGGYRSQSISLVGRRPMDNPDIGVILLHKDSGEGGTTVSARQGVRKSAGPDAKGQGQRRL